MAKDAVRLTTLRGILSAFTNESVALKRTPQDKLKDDEALAVLKRLAKQRKDSIEQFEKASRADLADNEKAELKIIEEFLPEEVGEDIIRNIVMSKKEELGVTDKSKMGILIGAVMKDPKAAGADGALVKKIVEELIK